MRMKALDKKMRVRASEDLWMRWKTLENRVREEYRR